MKILKLLSLILITLVFFQCKSEDESPDPSPIKASNVYEKCCDLPFVEMDFNPGKVYVPNIFTPNGDGVNDLFYVLAGEGIDQVKVFQVKDTLGNLVYEALDFMPNDPNHAWYPTENDYNGYYEYYLKVKNTNEEEFELNGGVCAFVCLDEHPFEFSSDCGFPTQDTGQGGHDPALPTNEPDCL